MSELQSEFNAEMAAVGDPAARAREARKRLSHIHVAFFVGVAIQIFGLVAGPLQRPGVFEMLLICLFGGYFIASSYAVFPPIWRKLWGEEKRSFGCNPIGCGGMIGSFFAIMFVSAFAGPFGGGLWNYIKLRRIASAR